MARERRTSSKVEGLESGSFSSPSDTHGFRAQLDVKGRWTEEPALAVT